MADQNQNTEDSSTKTDIMSSQKFDFAFYRYKRNRETTTAQSELEMDNFSLSLVTTSLITQLETDLRQFISRRVSKGSMFTGHGNISAVILGGTDEEDECADSLCYYCLLTHERDELDALLSGSEQSADEYIICLVSPHVVMLDLFRAELDCFSRKILDLLEPDLDGLDDRLQGVLSNWYPACTEYLCNCVRVFGEDIKYLIYCALLDIQLDIKCSDRQLHSDVVRFLQCCSLSELLSTMRGTENRNSDSSCSESGAVVVSKMGVSAGPDCAQKSTLVADNNGHRFHNCSYTDFCEEWTSMLLSGESQSAVYIKQVIESYKLKAIQDMNTLKRMLKHAESDYYALFRCYHFVRSCGNDRVLLRHACNEASSTGQHDSLSTIAAIQGFLVQEQNSAQSSQCPPL